MGLLDDFGAFIKTPEGQGLLSAAFGGMASAGRGAPVNTLGRAGLAGLTGYANTQDRQLEMAQNAKRNQMFDLQLSQLKKAQENEDAIRAAGRDSMLSPAQMTLMNGRGPTVDNAAAIETTKPSFDSTGFVSKVMAIDPLKGIALQQSMAKETPFNKIDPEKFTPESIAKFAQSRNYGDLIPARKMEVAPGGQVYNPYTVQPGQVLADPNKPFSIGANGALVPNVGYQTFEITKARAGKPQISVDARNFNTQESEQSKAYGKTLGEIRSGITNAAFSAPGQMAKLNRIEELLKGIDTGSTTALQLAQAANAVGLKIDPKLGVKEAAESLSREFAGGLRQPGTGPMTDKDFENYLTQVPSLSKSAEGRAQIIATTRAKLARDIEIGKLARDYAKKNNGVIDDGFMDVVSDYVAQNPVVQRESTSGRINAFPDTSAIEAELARRKGRR